MLTLDTLTLHNFYQQFHHLFPLNSTTSIPTTPLKQLSISKTEHFLILTDQRQQPVAHFLNIPQTTELPIPILCQCSLVDLHIWLTTLIQSKSIQLVHATIIQWQHRGICLTGPPGSGKSQLAYQLIQKLGAKLVCDDSPFLTIDADSTIHALCPPTMQGRIHLRDSGFKHLMPDQVVSTCACQLHLAIDNNHSFATTLPTFPITHRLQTDSPFEECVLILKDTAKAQK